MFRVGHGFDVHRLLDKKKFAEKYPERSGHKLILAGVEIEHPKVLEGHSDADVLTHAICDSLLGAAGLKDIGNQFPSTDPLLEGINSQILLAQVGELISNQWKIENIDATVLAEKPKLAAHILIMREQIAATLKLDISQINIKATTTEKLGFVGREEGIAAEVVSLLSSLHS